MRYIQLAVAGWLLFGLTAAARTDEPAGKGQPANVSAAEIDRLILHLGDDDLAKRSAAKKQLEELGEPAAAALKRSAESSEDPEVRKAAKTVLDKLDARARGILHVFTGSNSWVNGVAFSADGKRVVSASWDGTVRYWDL